MRRLITLCTVALLAAPAYADGTTVMSLLVGSRDGKDVGSDAQFTVGLRHRYAYSGWSAVGALSFGDHAIHQADAFCSSQPAGFANHEKPPMPPAPPPQPPSSCWDTDWPGTLRALEVGASYAPERLEIDHLTVHFGAGVLATDSTSRAPESEGLGGWYGVSLEIGSGGRFGGLVELIRHDNLGGGSEDALALEANIVRVGLAFAL